MKALPEPAYEVLFEGLRAQEAGLVLLSVVLKEPGTLGDWSRIFSKGGHLPNGPKGRGQRVARDILPLPLTGRSSHVVKAVSSKSHPLSVGDLQALCARCKGGDVWHALVVIALNDLGGKGHVPRHAPDHQISEAQRQSISFLRSRCEAFCGLDPAKSEVPTTPTIPLSERLRGRKMDYHGGTAVQASRVSLEQVEPGLPPLGAAGQHDITENLSPDLEWFMRDPERCLKRPDDVERPVPHPKVLVDSQADWDELGSAFVSRGICRVIDYNDVPHFEGEPVLAGCFGVRRPGKFTASGKGVLRLIMDVRTTNSLLLDIDGDMHKLPVGSSILRTVILPHEVAIFNAEDLSVSFYQLSMPTAWHKYFVFRRPVSGAAVGRPDLSECYLAAIVLPMGFKLATGIMQCWHRRLLLGFGARALTAGMGLDPSREHRGDRPFPVSAFEGPRSVWKVYIDDFSDTNILPE